MIQKRSIAILSFAAATFFAFAIKADMSPPDANVGGTKNLLDISAAGSEANFTPDDQANGQVAISRNADPAGVVLTIAQGTSKYPGVVVNPSEGKPWDCSAFGHIEARVTNLGTTRFPIVMVVADSPDGKNSSSDVVRLNPGQTSILKVVFGYSYGIRTNSINSASVDHLLIFAGEAKTAPEPFRIETLQAGGAAGEKIVTNPANVITKPVHGVVFGPGIALNARQLLGNAGARAAIAADGNSLNLSFNGPNQSATLRPAMGIWSLNDALEVKVKIKNSGPDAVTPSVRLDSKRGSSDVVAMDKPLAPGTEAEITVPFIASQPWVGVSEPAQNVLEGKKEWGGNPGTGTPYYSNETTGITVLADGASELQVTSIVADLPKPDLPAWLGQRPPMDGDWVKTFEDNFDGDSIDLKNWNIYTAGDYHIGKYDHFSKENVIVKDGKVTLRIEKKRGRHDDDPNAEINDLATGYLDTYGKFTQRYGYFEFRVKLSTIPAMFPAFWLMPDRGIAVTDKNRRESTKEGGMEFDIMETQSIWGPYRHDWGMHWDSYMKYHKSNGSFTQYVQPDSDGYITVGLLWEPGKVTEYDNGKETGRWQSPRISNVQEYMIIDNVTGGWENAPVDETQLPGDLTVDYVRVWQRKDLASPEDGTKPNDGGPFPPGQGPIAAPPTAPAK
ncbi:MAG TPA: glycoside hydrolase family 16 protein [Candidatus Methylacidiphilales bacterium]